jgi:hypothetical protein
MRRPGRIGGVGLVEVGEHGGDAIAGGRQREQHAGQKNVVEGEVHDVPSVSGRWP